LAASQKRYPFFVTVIVDSTHVAYSRDISTTDTGAPVLGEHTGYVLREILGYDETRSAALLSDGAVAPAPVR
jgi:hypothetical protein